MWQDWMARRLGAHFDNSRAAADGRPAPVADATAAPLPDPKSGPASPRSRPAGEAPDEPL